MVMTPVNTGYPSGTFGTQTQPSKVINMGMTPVTTGYLGGTLGTQTQPPKVTNLGIPGTSTTMSGNDGTTSSGNKTQVTGNIGRRNH